MVMVLQCDNPDCNYIFGPGDKMIELRIKEKTWTGTSLKENPGDRLEWVQLCIKCGLCYTRYKILGYTKA